MANIPLTGSWGKEKFEQSNGVCPFTTTAKEHFDGRSQKELTEMEENKFAKFVRNNSILVYSLNFLLSYIRTNLRKPARWS